MKRENVYRAIILVMGILLIISFYGINMEKAEMEESMEEASMEQSVEEVSFAMERDSLLDIIETFIQKDSMNAAQMDSMANILSYAATGNSINANEGREMYKTVMKVMNKLEVYDHKPDADGLLSYFHPSYSQTIIDISPDNKVKFIQEKYPDFKMRLEEAGNSPKFKWKMDIGSLAYARTQGRIGLLLLEGEVDWTDYYGTSHHSTNIIQITLKKYENRWLIGHVNSTRFAKD